MNKIVVGLGFGDEGKGLTTSYLAENSSPNSIVVRHNGGQQAGHTVEYEGKTHVFSQLGAGTLQGLPTYFTKECTFYPSSFLREYKMLEAYKPSVILHPLVKITLAIDIDYNRTMEDSKQENRHGSVGMGFGATIQRNEDHFTLYAKDLRFPKVVRAKIENIHKFYYHQEFLSKEMSEEIDRFMETISEILKFVAISDLGNPEDLFEDVIFETSQGVLLDQYHGFFPNVTRSNTTSKNALQYCKRETEIYYVTRTYQTRHGNGFMSNEDNPIPILSNNENETNKSHKYQGDFRVTELDIELLSYAIISDNMYSNGLKKNLVITCNDQLKIDLRKVVDSLQQSRPEPFKSILTSYGPSQEDIRRFIY